MNCSILVNFLSINNGNLQRGIGKYAINFIKELSKSVSQLFIISNLGNKELSIFDGYNINYIKINLYEKSNFSLDENTWRYYANSYLITYFIEHINPNLYLDLNYIGEGWASENYTPDLDLLNNIKKAFILYDLIPLQFEQYLKNLKFKDYYIESVKKSTKFDYVYSLSETSLRKYNKYTDFESYNLTKTVIYGGKNNDFVKEVNINSNLKNFILSIPGGSDYRKNISKLLSGFLEFRKRNHQYNLVIVGNMDNGYIDNLLSGLNEDDKSHIFFYSYAEDDFLNSLYMSCDLVISASLDEGLCLPIVYAMQLGKKISVSDIEIFHEICHKYPLNIFFNPADTNDIAKAIEFSLSNDYEVLGVGKVHGWDYSVSKFLNSISLDKCSNPCLIRSEANINNLISYVTSKTSNIPSRGDVDLFYNFWCLNIDVIANNFKL